MAESGNFTNQKLLIFPALSACLLVEILYYPLYITCLSCLEAFRECHSGRIFPLVVGEAEPCHSGRIFQRVERIPRDGKRYYSRIKGEDSYRMAMDGLLAGTKEDPFRMTM